MLFAKAVLLLLIFNDRIMIAKEEAASASDKNNEFKMLEISFSDMPVLIKFVSFEKNMMEKYHKANVAIKSKINISIFFIASPSGCSKKIDQGVNLSLNTCGYSECNAVDGADSLVLCIN
jgi:hypothetical protein